MTTTNTHPDIAPDAQHYHGHHTWWCSDRDEGPHDEAPVLYCERQIGGAEAVTEPGWNPVQLWVSTISAFLHGNYTGAEVAAEERNRSGVQLSALVRVDSEWVPSEFNMRSGEARTLAALLVAAADISDGIARFGTGK